MGQFFLHVIFWVIILFWRANGDWGSDAPISMFVLQHLVRLPIVMMATYSVVYWILPKYLINRRNYMVFVILFVLNFAIAFRIDTWLISSDFMYMILQPPHLSAHKMLSQLHPFRNSFSLFSVMGLAAMFQFFYLFRQKENLESKLIQEQLETQHAFLKAQVNPHFLFNALNNLYSMAVEKELKELAEGLNNLSGIMRYLTYESGQEKVALEKEIKLIQDYLDIQRLRYQETDELMISFKVEGEVDQLKIAPVLLLPLVENAFKHGVKAEQVCFVMIKLSLNETTFEFNIYNSMFPKSEKAINEKGIGLENVRQRLELMYPENHQLTTEVVDENFVTDLSIDL